jgi:hypothetical protein
MNHPTLKQRYERICQTYVDQFCAKHQKEFEGWDDGGAWMGTHWISLENIRYDIDNQLDKETIWQWLETDRDINFRNYLKLDKQ